MQGTNEVATCPTCCRPVRSPYRVYGADGKVQYGCIDDAHTGHLVPISESSRWHNRPVAKAHRAQVKRHLRSLGIRK